MENHVPFEYPRSETTDKRTNPLISTAQSSSEYSHSGSDGQRNECKDQRILHQPLPLVPLEHPPDPARHKNLLIRAHYTFETVCRNVLPPLCLFKQALRRF